MPLAHPLRTAVAALGAAAGLTAAFVVGAASTGGTPAADRSTSDPAGPRQVAFHGTRGVDAASSCDELLAWYVDRGVAQVGPYGWGGYALPMDYHAESGLAGAAPVPAAGPTTVRQVNGETGTNVQETGVDEPDTAKTDGHTLYTVTDGGLVVYDVDGAAVTRLAGLALGEVQQPELLLDGETLLAIGASRDGRSTELLQVDVSDRSHPQVTHRFSYDAGLVAARLIGGTTRLVLRSDPPDLDFTTPGHDVTEQEALRDNQQAVRDSGLADWLPTVSEDGAEPGPLLGCDQVALPTTDSDAGLGTVSVVGFATDDPSATSASGVAVSTDLAYLSTSKLYLATSAYSGQVRPGGPVILDEQSPVAPLPGPIAPSGSTQLYAFDLDGQDARFVASGTVDGAVRDRWSMDEYDGVLRLAVTPTARTGDFTSVVTMRQDGDALVEAGRVDRLGVGEQLESVRWFDQLAIVVTYRQVDPLFAIDLTDADHPRLMGELSLPGFSAYLHPLGAHRLLGLGQSGSTGEAQAALFNVTDLTHPRLLSQVAYGQGSLALATTDPRQLTWLPDGRTVLSVIEKNDGAGTSGYVSELKLSDGHLSNTMTRVEYGDEVTRVRLVPLPDGRVVLVSGDGASFYDL